MAATTAVRTPSRLRPSRDWWMPAWVAAGSAVVFAFAQSHLIDDVYITLSYARNLAFHGHWGLLPDATSNTATSPLNVLLLAVLSVLVRNAVLAAGLLYVLCQVLLVLALRRIGSATGLPAWFPVLTVTALTVNPLLLSSIGLEVALGAAGLGWLLVYAVERRPVAFGLVAGALTLVRVDLLLFVAVVFVARRRCWVHASRSVLAAVLVAAPWFAFSWVALGAAVPDTLVIKTLQGARSAWGPWHFGNGPGLYWSALPWQAALAFLPFALAVAAAGLWAIAAARDRGLAARLTPYAGLALGGCAHYAAYTQLNVPPYHWYYGPSIVAATVFTCAVVAGHARRVERIVAVTAVAAVLAASVLSYARPGLPRTFAPITSNYTSSEQYADIGRDVGRLVGAGAVGSVGEIGVLAYTCDCEIVDVFADRGRLAEAVADREAMAGRWVRALLRVNFAFFDYDIRPLELDYVLRRIDGPPPPDYLAHWTIAAPMLGTQQLYLLPARPHR